MRPQVHYWYRIHRAVRITLVMLGALVLWEIACRGLGVREILLPPPSRIAVAVAQDPGYFLLNGWHTLYATLIGFVLAVVFGVVLAVAIVSSRFLEETLYVLLVTVNSIPKVAMAPLFVVWMGTGIMPKVSIAATITVFVIVIDLVLGLRSVDPDMVHLARSLKGSRWKMLVKIRFPNALPNLFAGMKVGITLALIGTIVGEFVASDRGLGHAIVIAQGQFEIPSMFAAIILLAIMGTVLFFIVDMLERIALPWHVSRRNAEAAPQQLVEAGY